METLLEMHRRGDREGIWKRYCGFLDLSMEEFTASQDRWLEDQLETWTRNPLVTKILGGTIPSTVAEFRERAPLTTYEDYAAVLLGRNEQALPGKAYEWIHTSGRSGEYEFKWIPWTRQMYDVLSDCTLACFILGACRKHGEIALKEGDRLMFSLAPLPFISGLAMRALHEQFNFRIWPPYEEALTMDFFERIREGIKLAFSDGIDYFYGITSIMLSISEQFENVGKTGASPEMKKLLRNPRVLFRLLGGLVKSKLRDGRLRPRDLWNVKGIMCSGMDTSIYKERIRLLWGEYPWEVYGCTEFGFIAHQHFASPGLVFCNRGSYYEFMDLDDYNEWKEDRSARPRLRLLSDVEAGREYALVCTSFHGGVLVRYVLGDSLKVASLSDESAGLRLPQWTFSSRIDDTIDIAGFTRLTEKLIWSAIEASTIRYVDWVVAKEYRGENPILHLYIEACGDCPSPDRVQVMVHEQLKRLDQPYRDLEEMAGIKPLVVTLFSRGTFARFLQERQAAGIDLAHSKPPHMNPSEETVGKLTAMSALKI
jgi:GH3 auxin-responsive promoter